MSATIIKNLGLNGWIVALKPGDRFTFEAHGPGGVLIHATAVPMDAADTLSAGQALAEATVQTPRPPHPFMTQHMEDALMMAAQCWYDKETSGIEMNTVLAEAVARRIASLMASMAELEQERDALRLAKQVQVPLTEVEVANIFFKEMGILVGVEPIPPMAFTRAIERHHGIGVVKPETEAKP